MADESQALAGLKVMIAVAKADGHLSPAERRHLEAAIEELAPGSDLAALLEQELDLEAELDKIEDADIQRATYRAALLLSAADGEAHPEEDKVLARLRAAYGLLDESATVKPLLDEAREARDNMPKAASPEERAKQARTHVQNRALLAGILGANPVPFLSLFTEVGIYVVQVELVRDIGRRFGHELSRKEAGSLFLGIVGLGLARTGLTQLVKFLPVWGSVVGAAAGFTATYALGATVLKHFAEGGDLKTFGRDAKKEYEAIKKGEAKAEYEKAKGTIEEKAKQKSADLDAAAKDIQAGKASADDLVGRIDV
jgi:uncharacterized protein (DUF697 family)/tellurite resistance protein